MLRQNLLKREKGERKEGGEEEMQYQTKTFLHNKEPINKVKKQVTEQISVNHAPDKGFIFMIYEKLKSFNNSKTNNPGKKYQNNLSRFLTKDETQMSNTHILKMLSIAGHQRKLEMGTISLQLNCL